MRQSNATSSGGFSNLVIEKMSSGGNLPAALNRFQRKVSVQLPRDFLTRLAHEKLFLGDGYAAKLCLMLFAVAGVSDKTVHLTYDEISRFDLDAKREHDPDHAQDAILRLQRTGLIVREADNTNSDSNLFSLDKASYQRDREKAWFVSGRLWETGWIKEWDGAELGLYLWLSPSERLLRRQLAPRSSEFKEVGDASKALNLSAPKVREALRSLEKKRLVVTVVKDRKHWMLLTNPDLWPVPRSAAH